jgi:hypothetical protein
MPPTTLEGNTIIYLVVYDWVDGTTIYDAFQSEEAAGNYIEDVLQDTRRCQIREIRLWGDTNHSFIRDINESLKAIVGEPIEDRRKE